MRHPLIAILMSEDATVILRTAAIAVLVVMLGGCTNAASTDTPKPDVTQSVVPSGTPTPRTTSQPTLTATSTHMPTRTPSPALTASPAPPADFVSTFLFQGTQYPDCLLPCWRDLVVGESTLEQVQTVLNNDFQLDLTTGPAGFNDLLHLGHVWSLNEAESMIGIDFWIDNETHILNAISFWWSENSDLGASPKRVIQELGTPSQWWFEAEDFMGLRADSAMGYDTGILFTHTDVKQYDATEAGEFCLDSDAYYGSALISSYAINSGEIIALNNYLAQIGLSSYISTGTTIGDFGYSIDQMVDLALNPSQPCIEFEY